MSSNLARLNAVNSLEFRLLVTMFELHLLKQMNAGADCEGKKVAQSKNVVFTLSEKYSRQIGELTRSFSRPEIRFCRNFEACLTIN